MAFLIIVAAAYEGVNNIYIITFLTVLGNAGVFVILGLRLRQNPSWITGGGEEGYEGKWDE